jgi:hypothetical protein
MAIADERTIETSRGKAHCKSPFLARQLSVFFTSTRYRVVKIVCSCLGPSLEVIALCPVV